MTISNVLVTGMSGLIGGAVRKRLRDQYALSALNRRPVPGVTTFQADIADFEAITPAFVGQDVVVHLAGSKGGDWNELLQTNVVGTYNVFEASRQAGVQRVIFASSGATISGWQKEEPYKAIIEGRYADVPATWPMLTHQTPVRSWSLYGSTKVWGEALARHFTETTDLSIICLRIAVVVPEDRPTSPSIAPVWCSQRDVAQMVERCVAAPKDVRFDIFNVVSNNKWGFRDIAHAREVVGYEPQDSAETYPL
jgi:nucleoside-diphosphate-sugar epimerase